MTVWIVEQGYDYEGDTVTSVHASEEGALAAMCKLIERHDEGQPPVEPVARRRRCGVQGVEGGAGSTNWHAYLMEVEP